MKIKNVIKAAKARRAINVVRVTSGDVSEFWLGDGRSLWLMPQYFNCDKESIFGIYDFSESEQEKTAYTFKIAEETKIDFKDNDGAENVEITDLMLSIRGAEIRPVMTERGVYYIEEKYFGIFSDKPWELRLKINRDREPYFAVYEGLMLIGIIMPAKPETPELCDLLRELYENMVVKV